MTRANNRIFGKVACFLALMLLAFTPAMANEVGWKLFSRHNCFSPLPEPVQCGNFGIFTLAAVAAVPSVNAAVSGERTSKMAQACVLLEEGSGVPEVYPIPAGPRNFEFAGLVHGGVFHHTITAKARRGGGVSQSPPAQPGVENTPTPVPGKVAMIDFTTSHGDAVEALIQQVVGPDAQVERYNLEDFQHPDLPNAVTDFHLLGTLCQIVEAIEIEGKPAPAVLNMSFGRALQADETFQNTFDAQNCADNAVACQVGKVFEHLRTEHEVVLAAAAGNHQELLAPAGSNKVLAIGALDMVAMKHGQVVSSWESPSAIAAIAPGYGLCLEDQSIPSGTSHSTALFSGALARALTEDPSLDPYRGELWSLSDDGACFRLSLEGFGSQAACNQEVTELVNNIGQCADVGGTGGVEILAIGPSDPTAGLLPHSFDDWVEFHHPAPEPDFCVPCQGGGGGYSSLTIGGLDAQKFMRGGLAGVTLELSPDASGVEEESTVVIEEIFLRKGDALYPLNLSTANLGKLAAGEVSKLTLIGYDFLFGTPQSESMSLVYSLREKDTEGCTMQGPTCFWSSTPLLFFD